jgi:hypothetical protein
MNEISPAMLSEMDPLGYDFQLVPGFTSNVFFVSDENKYVRLCFKTGESDGLILLAIFKQPYRASQYRRIANFEIANPNFSIESIIEFINQDAWEKY